MTHRTHTIVQLTDTHLVAGGLLHGTIDPSVNLRAALGTIGVHATTIDALLLTGDLANDGEPGAYRQVREIVAMAAADLGVPALYGIGNHDERAAFRTELLDGSPAPVGTIAGATGTGLAAPVDYTVEIGGLRIVMLDSTVPGHHFGEVSDEQLAWLDSVLASPAPAGTLLAVHHPPLAWSDDAPNAELRASTAFTDPSGLARVVRDRDVAMIVSGHYHEPLGGQLGGVPVWVGASTAMAHEVDAVAGLLRIVRSSGLSIIDVFDDGTAVARAVNCLERPVLCEMPLHAMQEDVRAASSVNAAGVAAPVAGAQDFLVGLADGGQW